LLLIAIVLHHNLPCFRATLLRQSFRHIFVLKERDCPSRSVGTQYNITHSFSCFSYTGIAKCAIRHFYVEENEHFLSLLTELELHLPFCFSRYPCSDFAVGSPQCLLQLISYYSLHIQWLKCCNYACSSGGLLF